MDSPMDKIHYEPPISWVTGSSRNRNAFSGMRWSHRNRRVVRPFQRPTSSYEVRSQSYVATESDQS